MNPAIEFTLRMYMYVVEEPVQKAIKSTIKPTIEDGYDVYRVPAAVLLSMINDKRTKLNLSGQLKMNQLDHLSQKRRMRLALQRPLQERKQHELVILEVIQTSRTIGAAYGKYARTMRQRGIKPVKRNHFVGALPFGTELEGTHGSRRGVKV